MWSWLRSTATTLVIGWKLVFLTALAGLGGGAGLGALYGVVVIAVSGLLTPSGLLGGVIGAVGGGFFGWLSGGGKAPARSLTARRITIGGLGIIGLHVGLYIGASLVVLSLQLYAAVAGGFIGGGAGLATGAAVGATLTLLRLIWRVSTDPVAEQRYVVTARLVAATVSVLVAWLALKVNANTWLWRSSSWQDALAMVMIAVLPALIAAGYFAWVAGWLANWQLQAEADARWAAEYRAETNAR